MHGNIRKSDDNFPSHTFSWPTTTRDDRSSRLWQYAKEVAIVVGVAVMTLGAVCTLVGADVLMTGVLHR